MKIFISHCSNDAELIRKYKSIFESDKDSKIFFSSSPDTGIESGGEIINSLNNAIKECDVFVCIITENYVRSQFCLYELNVATFLYSKERTIIPIVTNSKVYSRIKSTIEHLNLIYIDASKKDEFNSRIEKLFKTNNAQEVESFRQELANVTASDRSYIGMEESYYKNVLSYCEKHGIESINNALLDTGVLVNKVKEADEIIILSTTGASLIKKLSTEAFLNALLNRAKIKVIVPNQYSDFLYNVAELERPNQTKERFDELNEEFNSVLGYLIEVYTKAKRIKDDIGTIECFCAYNMLRQTIILVRKNEDVFGSLSITIPPKKTVDGTPTIVFNGKDNEGTLTHILLEHTKSIMNAAKNKDDYFNINFDSKKEPFFYEKASAQKYWKEKYLLAKENMASQSEITDSILIEVAAQHPLMKDGTPGKEFKARLDKCIELYKKYKAQDIEVKIYVPGSIHQYKNNIDPISLSQSGINYLLSHNVDENDIYPENINAKYKGDDGVYNTADECFVSSKIFFDDDYAKLITICSPNQVTRKTILYLEFGVIPLCYSVPMDNMYHDIISEIFVNLDSLLFKDHDWQNPNSEAFISTRQERKPK